MPKHIATMVAGPAADYPTQTITVFEPRAKDAKPRSRRQAHPFKQGSSREVSAALAAQLRDKRQPVKRGPRMFEIEVIEDEPVEEAPPPRPRAQRSPAPQKAEAPKAEDKPPARSRSGRSRRRKAADDS